MAKRGRKTKLTKAVLAKLESYKGKGYTDETLATFINVHPVTFSDWKQKALKAKRGIFHELHCALEAEEAAVEERIVNPWMEEVDKGNVKAIELAMKRHPRMRAKFKEEAAEVQASGSISFIVPKEVASLFNDEEAQEEGDKE